MGLNDFEKLRIWKAAIALAANVYPLVKRFPDDEKYAMSSQVRRAVVSVSTNIAEGFGRTGVKEKIYFYNVAYGSLLETKSLMILSSELGFLSRDDIEAVLLDITSLQKQINATKTSVKGRNA